MTAFLRSISHDVLRRLDIDGVYLTPDQARTLYAIFQRVISLTALSLTADEQEVLERLGKRVQELNATDRW